MGDGTYTLPPLVLSAPKSYQGNLALTGLTLSFGIDKHLSTYIGRQAQPFDPMAGVRNDRGVMMIGGIGDPLGIFDIAGIYVENNFNKDEQESFFAATLLAAVILKKPQLALKELPLEGKIIGLGIDKDLALHRGTGAIIYEYGAWQKAGLTTVDWGKASIDKFHFRSSFREAAENAAGIRFEVTNFDPFYHKPGITNFEFNHVLTNPGLLQKTTFIKGGNEVIWDGAQFIHK